MNKKSQEIYNALQSYEAFKERYEEPQLVWSIDVFTPPHPEYWRVNTFADTITTNGYQWDKVVSDASQIFKEVFGGSSHDADDKVLTIFAPTGTAANRLCTTPVLDTGKGLVANEISHLIEREAGSVIAQTGSNVYIIRNDKKKISADELDAFLQHRAQNYWVTQKPSVVSITNPMENGEVYSCEEVNNLAEVAHKHDLLIQMDGARLPLAVAHNKCTYAELTTELDVDMIAFGGSKNAMYRAEATVFLPPFFSRYGKNHLYKDASSAWNEMRSHIKRHGGLVAQSAGTAAQFIRAFQDDFALELAEHQIDAAKILASKIEKVSYCAITVPVESNVVMVSLPHSKFELLNKKYPDLMVFDQEDPQRPGNTVVRFMTTYATSNALIDDTVQFLHSIGENSGAQLCS